MSVSAHVGPTYGFRHYALTSSCAAESPWRPRGAKHGLTGPPRVPLRPPAAGAPRGGHAARRVTTGGSAGSSPQSGPRNWHPALAGWQPPVCPVP
jgi:hypothetical protein